MASLDPNIILQARGPQIMNPLEVRANALAVQGAEQQNALRAMQMRYAQEDRDSEAQAQNALRAYYASDRGDNALRSLAQTSPKMFAAEQARALKERETSADIDKKKSDASKTNFDTLSKQVEYFANFSRGVTDQASYDQAVSLASQFMPPEVMAKIPRQFTPQTLQAMQNFGINAVQQMQDATTRRGQDMTDSRTRTEGAANRAVQMRGQNMTSERAAESAAIEREKLRGTSGAVKLTEGQGKSTAFAMRAIEAENILDGMQGYNPGIKDRAALAVPFDAGRAVASDQAQRYDTAKRNFIASILRKETGAAVTKPEFEMYDKMYFPQVGESAQVIEDKKRQRALAIAGLQAEAGPGQSIIDANVKRGGAAQPGGFRIIGVE